MAAISIVIPAYNEAGSIRETVHEVKKAFAESPHECEIIVVDDYSSDDTLALARETDALVIAHPTNKGYGNALLTGIRNASHPWIGITDADGTYPLDALPGMLTAAEERDYDMHVGARQGSHYYESAMKSGLRFCFKWICEFVVGQPIPDINSGLRVIRRDMVRRFAPVLSGGFSFTTSITIIAFQTGHHVAYCPIDYYPRKGKSHVKLFRDSKRALQIIVMTIVLFNPIKLFLLQSGGVVAATLMALVTLLVFPATFPALLLAGMGFCAANIILAMGFLAVRNQLGVGDIAAPERGYVPRVDDDSR
ncbi:MAG: glycosyltransferase family 2 protein [Candidatus Hydrogenedentes bacterium]|nr:glycosyltransferase family 2 protein [Candidatus Hydrogenedentota bacterium]